MTLDAEWCPSNNVMLGSVGKKKQLNGFGGVHVKKLTGYRLGLVQHTHTHRERKRGSQFVWEFDDPQLSLTIYLHLGLWSPEKTVNIDQMSKPHMYFFGNAGRGRV